MRISTNKPDQPERPGTLNPKAMAGAYADGLTILRALLTPVIMAVIIMAWPSLYGAAIASMLFIIAALTDIFDDMIGGAETAIHRQFGWFDDIADLVLALGTLSALTWVLWTSGILGWAFAVPAFIIIARELLVGLMKGYELSTHGWPETRLSTLKNALLYLATCTLLAAPWLTTWIDSTRATSETIFDVFGTNSAYIWIAGQVVLWLAAIVSAVTGYALLSGKAFLEKDA